MLREQLDREDWLKGQREAFAAKIAKGFAQSERGELMDGDEAIKMLCERRGQGAKSRE